MLSVIFAAILLVEPVAVPIPGGEGGIGFDDLLFSPQLHRFIVPGGRTGAVFLLDPDTRRLERVGALGKLPSWTGGHGQGVTSADAREGTLFAADRGSKRLYAFPLGATAGRAAEAALEGGPDYVRWVEPTREVWVTEPGRKAIETFRFESGASPALVRTGRIEVPDGPESLVIDAAHGRAFTSTWHDRTLALSLRARTVLAQWSNGCTGARGLAADLQRGWVIVGCQEGGVTLVDASQGRMLGRAPTGAGVDLVAYDPVARRAYVPTPASQRLEAFQVAEDGTLRALWQAPTAPEALCVAADGAGHVLVCDPRGGRVLLFDDRSTPH